jgi:hypothetical protein
MYRSLVDAGWNALHAAGHGNDTILFGEIAPRGESAWGIFSGMRPLVFLRALYCVDSRYTPLHGSAAAIRGCPTTGGGSHRFRSQHPGLFQASGFTDHPYMRWYRPNREQNPDPVNHLSTSQYTSLGVLGNLTGALDRLQRVYGSHTRFPIYDTEFGYNTSPPKHDTKYPYVSPTTAASYINWAEYISWANPRLLTFDQYLLADPLPANKRTDWGGFASGLETYGNFHKKATYDAFRLPLYLPRTSVAGGGALEVWGAVRPVHFAMLDTSTQQTAELQFKPSSGGSWSTIRSLAITDEHGYFDTRVAFPSSGTVRVKWSYPPGDALLGNGATVYSRSVAVTVR